MCIFSAIVTINEKEYTRHLTSNLHVIRAH